VRSRAPQSQLSTNHGAEGPTVAEYSAAKGHRAPSLRGKRTTSLLKNRIKPAAGALFTLVRMEGAFPQVVTPAEARYRGQSGVSPIGAPVGRKAATEVHHSCRLIEQLAVPHRSLSRGDTQESQECFGSIVWSDR